MKGVNLVLSTTSHGPLTSLPNWCKLSSLLSKNYTYDLRTKMRSKLQIGFDIRIIVDSFLMVAAKSFLIKTRKSQRYHTQLQRNWFEYLFIQFRWNPKHPSFLIFISSVHIFMSITSIVICCWEKITENGILTKLRSLE